MSRTRLTHHSDRGAPRQPKRHPKVRPALAPQTAVILTVSIAWHLALWNLIRRRDTAADRTDDIMRSQRRQMSLFRRLRGRPRL